MQTQVHNSEVMRGQVQSFFDDGILKNDGNGVVHVVQDVREQATIRKEISASKKKQRRETMIHDATSQKSSQQSSLQELADVIGDEPGFD